MDSEQIKTQIKDLARRLAANAEALRSMCAEMERLQKALEREAGTQDEQRERSRIENVPEQIQPVETLKQNPNAR